MTIATIVAIGHAVWIVAHRRLGALDPDEAGYLAHALRFHRSLDPASPSALLTEIGRTGTAPLVPLASVVFLIIGPRNPIAAMLIQPVLLIATSAAIAACTRRIAGPRETVMTSAAFCALPTVMHATQSYWLGLGAAAATIGALWSLLMSQRCANRRVWGFGMCLGAMLLARTMTIAFVPALIAGAATLTGLDRRRLLRLAAAVGLGLLIAAPWYLRQQDTVFGYLGSYGYGDRAARFGPTGWFERVADRLSRYVTGGGIVIPLAAVVGVIAARIRRVASDGSADSGPDTELRLVRRVLIVVVALGTAALVSSPNRGGWFELPMVAVIIPLVASLMTTAPLWARRLVAATVSVQLLVSLSATWWIVPFGTPVPFPTHYEQAFAEYDPRFASDHRDELGEAADEWQRSISSVTTAMRASGSRSIFTVSGNMVLMNANAIQLEAELQGWDAELQVPETATRSERSRALSPTAFDRWGNEVARVLVLIRHPHTVFTPDLRVSALAAQADVAGWRIVEEVELPSVGHVEIRRAPNEAPIDR